MWLARDDPGVLSFVAEETRLSKVNKAAFHKSVYYGSLAGTFHSPTDRMASGEPDGTWRSRRRLQPVGGSSMRRQSHSQSAPTRRVDRPPVCANSTIGSQSSHIRGVKPCPMSSSRRDFFRATVASGALAVCESLGAKLGLPPVSAAETKMNANIVRLRPEIEPLVRLLEDTPRERIVEKVAAKVRQGTTYREVLAALLLAGIRNIQPRPSVGFKFHAVLVVQAVHLASLASPESDRWLPIFWALDYFKDAQAQDVREGDWTMGPVRESAVPEATKAREALRRAMDNWDEAATDAAIAGLVRSAKPEDVFEMLFNYGARDFRSIGHKAIFTANAHRTLQVIGWQHAKPVLRSLVYAFLQHEGNNPARRDAPADVPGRRNRELRKRLRTGWQSGRTDEAAVVQLLSTLRSGSEQEASEQVVELVNRGVDPKSVWDGVFAGAAELLLRQPGIVALHAVTTTNALHYAWQHCRDDSTCRYVLLENAAFLPMFRQAMMSRGQLADRRIDQLSTVETTVSREGVDAILSEISREPSVGIGKVLGYLGSGGKAEELMRAARGVLLLKANDAHDYKFSSAAFEDFNGISAPWNDRFLAASVLPAARITGPDQPADPSCPRGVRVTRHESPSIRP